MKHRMNLPLVLGVNNRSGHPLIHDTAIHAAVGPSPISACHNSGSARPASTGSRLAAGPIERPGRKLNSGPRPSPTGRCRSDLPSSPSARPFVVAPPASATACEQSESIHHDRARQGRLASSRAQTRRQARVDQAMGRNWTGSNPYGSINAWSGRYAGRQKPARANPSSHRSNSRGSIQASDSSVSTPGVHPLRSPAIAEHAAVQL